MSRRLETTWQLCSWPDSKPHCDCFHGGAFNAHTGGNDPSSRYTRQNDRASFDAAQPGRAAGRSARRSSTN